MATGAGNVLMGPLLDGKKLGGTMGMHDELYCDAELPDADAPAGAIFETTAFPEPFLFRYRITKAGRFIDACGRDLECDGYLEFFYYLDRSVETCSLAEYRAHFCRGQLDNIVRVHKEPEGADVRVIYGLASYRIFALGAPSGFMNDKSGGVEAPEEPAAKPRSEALGAFIDDWEAKHGELTPDELARATNELTLPPYNWSEQ
jgi:hypothetical protein